MCWILIAAAISSILIVIRGCIYETRDFNIDWKWWLLIVGSLGANLFACIGFHDLMKSTENTGIDHSSVLSVLSLLAAGVIAGNFAFSYQEAAADERILPNAISLIFVNLFYLLFGSVSYYFAKSTDTIAIEGLVWVLPAIMTLILIANTLNNYWDYREVDE